MLILVPPDQSSRAGTTLARAFHDDPLWTAMFLDPEERSAKLALMFTGVTRSTIAANGVAEATPGLDAVALWLPPGKSIGLRETVRSGFALTRFVMKLPGSERKRLLGVLRQLEDRRKALMPTDHWYLSAVGVDPERQGEGLGTTLIRAGTQRADQENTSMYLETETEDNVRWYQKFGFEVVEQIAANGLDLPVWLMMRPPSVDT